MEKSMRLTQILFTAAALCAAAGCTAAMKTAFAPHYEPQFYLSLTQVERPAKAQQRYGPQVLATTKDSGVTKFTFEDNLVRVSALPIDDRIAFDIRNKTDNSIRLVWNDAAFVDVLGKSSPVMHQGMKYTDCSGSKPASIIVRRGSIEDAAIPCDHVSFSSSSWTVAPLIAFDHIAQVDSATRLSYHRDKWVGKTVSQVIPLQLEDVVNDYIVSLKPSRYSY
jgi:hypothetical protein